MRLRQETWWWFQRHPRPTQTHVLFCPIHHKASEVFPTAGTGKKMYVYHSDCSNGSRLSLHLHDYLQLLASMLGRGPTSPPRMALCVPITLLPATYVCWGLAAIDSLISTTSVRPLLSCTVTGMHTCAARHPPPLRVCVLCMNHRVLVLCLFHWRSLSFGRGAC